MTDLKSLIEENLQAFSSNDLRNASLSLLKTLGYESDKTMPIEGSSPDAFLEILPSDKADLSSKDKALFSNWLSADILFQLTDEELSGEQSLFQDTLSAIASSESPPTAPTSSPSSNKKEKYECLPKTH